MEMTKKIALGRYLSSEKLKHSSKDSESFQSWTDSGG